MSEAPVGTAPDKWEFRDVIGRFATGVTIITAHEGGVDFGAAASAVSSVSDDPPMILICLNTSSSTAQAIRRSGMFAVNVLAEDSAPIAQRFAMKGDDKFSSVSFERGVGDVPLIAGSIAQFEVEVDSAVRGGTHLVFLGRVRKVRSNPGNPLAYFRGSFGRMETTADAASVHAVREYVVTSVTEEAAVLDADEIAQRLDTEPGRVFSALTALSHEGLVRRAGAGFMIEPVPDRVLFDYYQAKLAIEIGAASAAVGRIEPTQLAELRRLADATRSHIDVDRQLFLDPEGWIRANNAFHEYLVGLAGSVVLTETYKGLSLPSVELRAIGGDTKAPQDLVDDHDEIVEGYASGDRDRVLRALHAHANRPRDLRAPAEPAPS